MADNYDFRAIEKKWAQKWVDDQTFTPDLDQASDPYYALFMFPYPSAEGLHIGNFYAFTCVDVMAKFEKLRGKDVFEPFGFDAFGMHLENYALKIGETPQEVEARTTANFRKQVQMAGLSCDYTREVDTTKPEYYKWTQWIFTQLFEHGLAYQKEALLNWCPSCKTVLADEQIEGGVCERCKTQPEKKKMKQWFFKITEYADRLLNGLEDMDWSDITKAAQRNWIGRSEGAEVEFEVENTFLDSYPQTNEDCGNLFLLTWNIISKTDQDSINRGIDFSVKGKGEQMKITDQIKDFIRGEEIIDTPEKAQTILGALRESEQNNDEEFKILEVVVTENHVYAVVRISEESRIERVVKKMKGVSSRRLFQEYSLDYLKRGINSPLKKNKAKDYNQLWHPGYHFASLHKLQDFENVIEYLRTHSSKSKIAEFYSQLKTKIKVFTTRPDTLFGATYIVLSPEHDLVKQIITSEQRKEVEKYLEQAAARSELERTEDKDKTGVFTGTYAINPVNKERIPIWISDYVLMGYGTGAIMCVPAHDERDFEFAQKFDLPIKEVVVPFVISKKGTPDEIKEEIPFTHRNKVIALVKHWQEEKFLVLDFQEIGWKSFVVSGIDKKEDFIQAGLREIREETGFQNVRFIERLGSQIHEKFFAAHKNENRHTIFECGFFQLEDGERIEKASKENSKSEVLWMTAEEIEKKALGLEAMEIVWNWYKDNRENKTKVFTKNGVTINSNFLNGLETSEAKQKITTWLEEKGIGQRVVNFRLRDWCISRQRYWGPPVPVVYCEKCGTVAVPEKDLPVKLPKLEEGWEPAGDGRGPLAKVEGFMKTTCPKCGEPAEREADVMDNFLDSAWYFFRYIDPQNGEQIFDSRFTEKNDRLYFSATNKKAAAEFSLDPEPIIIRPDKPTVQRQTVCVVLKHWFENKFLCLDWKKLNWRSFVTGGLKEDEDLVAAAIREIREETGYQNPELVNIFPDQFILHFFRPHKDSNVIADSQVVLFQLRDSEQQKISQKELEKHEPVWVEESEVADFINVVGAKIPWEIYQKSLQDLEGLFYINLSEPTKVENPKIREAVRALIWDGEKVVLNCEINRKLKINQWELPGGGVDKGESLEMAVVRKAREETGLDCEIIKKIAILENNEHPMKEDWKGHHAHRHHLFLLRPTGGQLGRDLQLSEDEKDGLTPAKFTPEEALVKIKEVNTWWQLHSKWAIEWLIENQIHYPLSENYHPKWLPVDLYVGGNEHAVLHLMYTRFITMAFYDLGLINFDNPFKKFRANGMILKDGKKMSKSKGNVINPEEYGEKVGYDALKTYLLFLGPLSEDRSFTDFGVRGCARWIERIAKLEQKISSEKSFMDSKEILQKLHQTIKIVTADFEEQKYNTAIAKLMALTNVLVSVERISRDTWQKFLVLCAPFAPALVEEMWLRFGNLDSVFTTKNWPEWDEELVREDEIELVIQINGKLRDKIMVSADISKEEALAQAQKSDKIQKFFEGKEIRKMIFVPGKLVNIVVG